MKPVLFIDLDDTLINSQDAYIYGMKQLGFSQEDPTYIQARTQTKAQLPPLSSQSRSRILYFKNYLEIKGMFSPRRHLEMCETYEQGVMASIQEQWHALKRPALMERIKAVTSNIYIITNEATRMQMLKLSQMDPDMKYFKSVITSEEVGCEKPAQKIYDHSFKVAGVKPEGCYMVGDSLENDIEPAIRLGMHAVLTTEFIEPHPKTSRFKVISRLDELPEILKETVTLSKTL